MKIVRYTTRGDDRARLGVLLGESRVGDIERGCVAAGVDAALVAADVAGLLAGGESARTAAEAAFGQLSACADDPSLTTPLADCRLLAPVAYPSKIIAVGRNYRSHNVEMSKTGGRFPNRVPSAWIKANNTITGPDSDIVKPRATQKLDYETELAVVIGVRCKEVPEERAYDVVAGYTIMKDITARDITVIERAEGNQLLGKMFDTFAPMGPWFVTKDEIADPMALRLATRVNGETRQDETTGMMIWPIPKLIAYLSQMTLEPGDVIMTGTPSGVAMGHKPETESWYLEDGDVVESEIEGLGILSNRVVDAPAPSGSWQW